MQQAIIENIIATIICTVIAALAKKLWAYVKRNYPTSDSSPKNVYRKKTVHHQFFVSLGILVFGLPTAFLIPSSSSLFYMFIRAFLFISTGFSVIFAWGAFEAAFVFYPDDDSWHDKPTNDDSNNSTRKNAK